jgi:hypothetical protein
MRMVKLKHTILNRIITDESFRGKVWQGRVSGIKMQHPK